MRCGNDDGAALHQHVADEQACASRRARTSGDPAHAPVCAAPWTPSSVATMEPSSSRGQATSRIANRPRVLSKACRRPARVNRRRAGRRDRCARGSRARATGPCGAASAIASRCDAWPTPASISTGCAIADQVGPVALAGHRTGIGRVQERRLHVAAARSVAARRRPQADRTTRQTRSTSTPPR